MQGWSRIGRAALGAGLLCLTASALHSSGPSAPSDPAEADEGDWAVYGRTNRALHYSPLDEIGEANVDKLGLAWSMDLPLGNTNTQPLAIDGVLYFASGLSIVHAVDAATGKLLWRFDPGAGAKAGKNLRFGWGVRGISSWKGRIYTGTQDGRLIALEASTGKLLWSVQTFEPDYPAYISGAPRAFGGKVIIGQGGTTGASRGFVTAYDAETGEELWRFWTVPGDPARGFENEAMEMAAETWAGEWWKYGGGGDVWNATAYDAETDTVYIGTGSGYPWNRQKRSADEKGDRGDNLFICSIIALDGKTGAYKWHYQVVPGETWDFDATMDIELADIEIGGRLRKVLLHAPKSGHFYVIDRVSGELISAEPFVKVNWATGIDKESGRPIEAEGVRYLDGKMVRITPTALAAHNWMPMAYSPKTGLAYIPANHFEMGYGYSDIARAWTLPDDRVLGGAVDIAGGYAAGMSEATGSLLAWSPVAQEPVWSIAHPTFLNGGVLATGGNLVFQGTVDGWLTAYDAGTGKVLWKFDARAPIMAAPISYRAGGRQYVSVLTGLGMNQPAAAPAIMKPGLQERYGLDPVAQARRVLTFALGGMGTLPTRFAPAPAIAVDAAGLDARAGEAGMWHYANHCATCHGSLVIGITQAPDLRRSEISASPEAFRSVVRQGALEAHGMPGFGEFTDDKLEELRQYILLEAAALGKADSAKDDPARREDP
jgi:quinohemoprotein ethanol dehydrogenase